MNYIVVGASAAGINGVKTLRKLNPEAKITLISKDEFIYSRCILHHLIEEKRDIKQLEFIEDGFIEKNNIHWIKNTAVESVQKDERTVQLSNGDKITYDKLLLATGANTFYPPITGLKEARNVVGLRNLEDALTIKEKAKQAKNIIVMGAGLVGIDAISGLLRVDATITLVEFKGHMLSMQLDEFAAQTYEKAFKEKGVTQHFNVAMTEVLMDEQGNICSVKLSNGDELPCDLLIGAAGVRSNVALLEGSGIETDRFGLIFDAYGKTSDPFIFGAGDISGRNPIWPTAVKEGIIAASNMSNKEIALTDFFASKSTMNFLDIATLSLGTPMPPDDSYTVETLIGDKDYKKIIHKDGVIYGAIIQGDLAYAGVLTQLIKEKIDISKVKKPLFDIDYSDFFNLNSDLQFDYE